ncbi:MAG: MATE family efflux transporter [Phycisphaerales bacterium]
MQVESKSQRAQHATTQHRAESADAPRPALRESTGLTADGRLKSGRLAGLSMRRAIWVLAWPVCVESLLMSLVAATDTYVAAQLSAAATNAIGGASYLLWFIGLVLMAIGVGATALISRAVGASRLAAANVAVGQTLLLSVSCGAVVGVLIALLAQPTASILRISGEAFDAFDLYCWIVASSVPFMAIVSCMSACLRGAGDSLSPLRAMIAVNIANIFLSWALAGVDIQTATLVNGQTVTRTLIHNPFPFHMGVSGIALGTVIAEILGAALILRSIYKGTHGVRLLRKRIRPHWIMLTRLIRVGIPNFLETFGMWIGNFAVIWMVARLASPDAMGAHIIAIRIESFSFAPGFFLGTAAGTLAGQYLGARSPAHARRAILICTSLATASMGLTGVLFLLFPVAITGVLTSQPSHLDMVPSTLMVAGAVQIPFAIGLALRGALRGAGDVKWTMYITWISTYFIRIPLVYVASGVDIDMPASLTRALGLTSTGEVLTFVNPFKFGGTLAWVWVALSIEVAVRGVLFAYRFIKGDWARARV